MEIVSKNELKEDEISKLVQNHVKTSKHHFRDTISKCVEFINDLEGGIISLGWVCSGNSVYNPQNF